MFLLAKTEYIERPVIKSLSKEHGKVGTPIQLECSVDVQAGLMFTLKWQLPNKEIAKNVRSIYFFIF
jgi:hypothetical protein